jgi:hypothetical protein
VFRIAGTLLKIGNQIFFCLLLFLCFVRSKMKEMESILLLILIEQIKIKKPALKQYNT